jgi:hypothetical protein
MTGLAEGCPAGSRCPLSPAEGEARAARDFALIGSDADPLVKNERAVTRPQEIAGENASRREADSVSVIEAAPTCPHGEMLTGQQHWLRQGCDCGDAFGQLLVAAAQAVDLALQVRHVTMRGKAREIGRGQKAEFGRCIGRKIAPRV